MKQNNKKLKRECDVCKIQYESWVSDFEYDEDKYEKMKSSVNKYCPACRNLKEK